jgi:tRNA U34 5-methylaminomethyl-2-thiouridine-forming methyltransferase MnmC
MERILKITEDGSHTMFVKGLEESFHSSHGAIQESMHVFIKQGLNTIDKTSVNILELGFGTGLNAVLSLKEAQMQKLEIYYHAVEKYPLKEAEFKLLNYEQQIEGLPSGILQMMHNCPWGEPVQISEGFTLYKEKADFRSMKLPGHFDLIYYDAFSPDKQPELWTGEVIGVLGHASDPGTILVTYSSNGLVRRTLNSCGFEVSKVAGPPGKREMIRAIKR